jgi:hypothetical protein
MKTFSDFVQDIDQFCYIVQSLLRKNTDVNKHERLSNITLRHKLK